MRDMGRVTCSKQPSKQPVCSGKPRLARLQGRARPPRQYMRAMKQNGARTHPTGL